jgi:hypothetical protein
MTQSGPHKASPTPGADSRKLPVICRGSARAEDTALRRIWRLARAVRPSNEALAVAPEGALAQRPPDKTRHRIFLTDLHCESQTGKRP